jgi:hypothetical protein
LIYEFLLSSYDIPVWLLLIISILALTSIFKFFIYLQNRSKIEYLKYIEDNIYNAKWKWKWSKDKIVDLQCYCPTCDAVLVYDDTSHIKPTELLKTEFICENCNSQIVATIRGGNKNYAINAVKREIERRVRTEEYKTSIKNN